MQITKEERSMRKRVLDRVSRGASYHDAVVAVSRRHQLNRVEESDLIKNVVGLARRKGQITKWQARELLGGRGS